MTVDIDSRKWSRGQVLALHHWAERLYSLKVEAEVEPFEAGQFGRLGLVIEQTLISRPYSFVNAPQEHPLEFYFVEIPGGQLTPRLAKLRAGDPLWVSRKASGFFTLSRVPAGRYLWLLATGTALGPFLSILKTGDPWHRFEKIVLVHGVRFGSELTYQETIAEFQARYYGQFKYLTCVTREHYPGVIFSRITTAIENGVLESRAGLALTPKDSQIMICGNPAMVKDTVALLEARGFRENLRKSPGQITTERYW